MNQLQKHIADTIREIRTTHNMSQADFGRSIGVAPNTVSRWECGNYEPSLTDLATIMAEFQVFPGLFFGATELNARLNTIASLIYLLTPENARSVMEFAQCLLSKQSPRPTPGRKRKNDPSSRPGE